MFNYASLTKNGAALITRAVNGEKFVFTRMEYGNGIPSEFNSSQTSEEIKSILSERTSLVSKKADIGMYSISTKNNCATLTGKIINSSLTEDFLAKELGVFGKIGEEAEVLVAYFIATESPDPINQAALVGQEHKIIVDVATGNAADITIEYSPEIYATKEDFDAAVAQNAEEHTAIQNLINEKIGSIDISAALSHIKQYDFIVDSNETLLAWANCTDGSMKSVLVKSGEYTLDGKMINLVNAGTKFVFAEDGNKIIVSNYMRGIGATENYGAVIIGLNVELNFNSLDEQIGSAFYRGMICYNCTGNNISLAFIFNECTCINCTTPVNGSGYGFNKCTCSNCTVIFTGVFAKGFYECTCSNCTANGTDSDNGSGFMSCNCSNCIGTVINTGNSSCDGGFLECTCSNCIGTGTSTSGNGGGFMRCTCSNCIGTGTSTSSYIGAGFLECTCSNCIGTGTSTSGNGYGFKDCKHCSSCRAGETASTTATWGGTNTYIDSDSCDYVAA